MHYTSILSAILVQLLFLASGLAAPTSHRQPSTTSNSPDLELRPNIYNLGDYVRVQTSTLKENGKYVPTSDKVSPHPGVVVGGPEPDSKTQKDQYHVAMISTHPLPGRPKVSIQRLDPGTPVKGDLYLHKAIVASHHELRLWKENGGTVRQMSHENLHNLKEEMKNHVHYRSPPPPTPPPDASSSHQSQSTQRTHQGIPTGPRSHRQDGGSQTSSRRPPSGGNSSRGARYHPYERISNTSSRRTDGSRQGRNSNHENSSRSGNHAASLSHGERHIYNDRHSRQQASDHASSSRHPQSGNSNHHYSAPRFSTSGRPPRGPSSRQSGGNTRRRPGERRSLQSREFNTY